MLNPSPVFVSFIPKQKIDLNRVPLNNSDKRLLRKQRLMAFDPSCSRCRKRLTLIPCVDNSANLVNDALCCPGCVKHVQAAARTHIGETTVTLTTKGRAHANRFKVERDRDRLKASLMETAPFCAHCERQLIARPGQEDSAHLVIDRLACGEHVKIVRAYAYLDQQEATLDEISRSR